MGHFELSVIVDGFDLDSEFQNAGLECLSYEVLVSRSNGVTTLDVEMQSASALDAVLQVVADLRTINTTVIRIDPMLVSVPELSERLSVSRETVRLWANGQRRSRFPRPYTSVGATALWFWSDVHAWLSRQKLTPSTPEPIPSSIVEAINGALAHRRNARTEGWLTPSVSPLVHLAQRHRATRPSSTGGWRDVESVSA